MVEPQEFHSFTLTSAPHEDFLSVHIKDRNYLKSFSFQQIKYLIHFNFRIGNQKRLRGNSWYTRGEYSQAIQCYRLVTIYFFNYLIHLNSHKKNQK